jgi:hypothetical protein
MSSGHWTDANVHDPGVTLLELLAFLGEALSSYQEQIAAEAQLRTRRRVAVALAAAAVLFWGCRRLRNGAGAQ